MTATKRTSLLCPNCNRLISSDEPSCPYCGISRPGSFLKNIPLSRSFFGPDTIVRTLIIANVSLFILSIALNPKSAGMSASPFTFLSPSNQSLFLLGATGSIPIGQFGRWWTLISASYLHGGVLHIFFNMAALSQIAPFILREYGFHRMIAIYTLGGVIGFLISFLAGVPFTIGASASLCALIGAALYYGKSRGGLYGQTVYKQLMGWVIGIFLFGFLVPGVNNWGHGGGLLGGVLLGYYLGYAETRKETSAHKTLAMVCIGLTVIILLWATVSACYYRIAGL